jgi:hypothetical protein
MAESKEDQVARLLSEGLDYYGVDEIAPAMKAWRAVLAVDPGNSEAIDYLQTADRRDSRGVPASERMSDGDRRIVHEARGMLEKGDWEGALEVLRSAPKAEWRALEFEATVEIVRSRLLRKYAARVGNVSAIPVLRPEVGDLTHFNLPPDAGFMLSLIDGTTRLSDLISLSGMDGFEALRIVGNLLDADILEMKH